MTFSVNTQAFLGALLILSLFIGVQGHSYVTSPQSRSNQKETRSGCRGPNCLGPCEVPLSRRSANAAVHSASRGGKITVQWPRNNHAGGFIRFAWAPTSQSDTASYFDERVQQISCHETGGCFPDDASNPNGGDSGPGDGSSRACSQSLTIPADLADGNWTLQWAWFGGAFSLGDYYSCIDYSISGGASGPTPVPKFVGGDYTYPNQQKCKFFNTDKLHVCVNEPCDKPIFTAATQQSGVPAYVQANLAGLPIQVPVDSTPITQPIVSTPSTTAAAPVVVSSTTTTGAKVVPAPFPDIAPVLPAPSTATSCTHGNMKCLVDGSYSTCNNGAWGPSQACGLGATCSPSGNFIYCITPPISTPSTPTSTPTVTPVAPKPTSATPVVPSAPSTIPSSTPAVTTSCRALGTQQCVGSNSYQTCGYGVKGPTWAGVQNCQVGLSCHASTTADNIYCY